MSNLKQIGLGFMQYVQDYDEKYPPSYALTAATPPNGNFWAGGAWFWHQIIYPYTKSVQIYVCPSNGNASFNATPYQYNYGANQLVVLGADTGAPDGVGAITKTLSMATVSRSAETYMIMDFGGYDPMPQMVLPSNATLANYYGWRYMPGAHAADSSILCRQGETYTADCQAAGRHFDGVAMTYADGHAKWLKSGTVVAEARKFVAGTQNAWDPQS